MPPSHPLGCPLVPPWHKGSLSLSSFISLPERSPGQRRNRRAQAGLCFANAPWCCGKNCACLHNQDRKGVSKTQGYGGLISNNLLQAIPTNSYFPFEYSSFKRNHNILEQEPHFLFTKFLLKDYFYCKAFLSCSPPRPGWGKFPHFQLPAAFSTCITCRRGWGEQTPGHHQQHQWGIRVLVCKALHVPTAASCPRPFGCSMPRQLPGAVLEAALWGPELLRESQVSPLLSSLKSPLGHCCTAWWQ